MNQNKLRSLQILELDALKEFDNFCKENNILFFLRGGSVMGTVKYAGFIPWDDDIDIAIPREDYERLLKLSKNNILADKYRLLSYRYCDEMQSYIPRIYLLEEERKKIGIKANTKLGLCLIDIFPIDGAPSNLFLRAYYYVKVYFLRLLASLDTVYDDEQKNMHKPWYCLVIHLLKALHINSLYSQRHIYSILERTYRKRDWKTSGYAGTITASLLHKEVMPSNIWGEGVFREFEGMKVRVPSDFDSYLKRLYGNNYLHEEPDKKKSHLFEEKD